MEYTTLGNTGMTVSKICLGCMSFGDPDWREWVLDEEAGRERVVEHHSWTRTVERTIEEYYALVPDRRQPDSTGPTISPAGSVER